MNAIQAENLTKIYRLYDRPGDRLMELIFHRPRHREFLALDGLSFTVERGRTVGIIGDNGAGKSTLLKILSKTLTPTRGSFSVDGIVSSLLELGSGFHPEFTGMENIYFYGSLRGIDTAYMKNKVDEIVGFSELGDFIRYPVKTYSSGMHVRLAFSVATSVDPDVLIIDEALSVGDQYFQKKCLDRMAEFRKQNKTILFCSHDMYQINTFCDSALWLHHGRIKMSGDSADVVKAYTGYEQMKAEVHMKNGEERLIGEVNSSSFLFIRDFTAEQDERKDLLIRFTVQTTQPFEGHLGWAILRKDRLQVSCMTTAMLGLKPVSFRDSRKVSISIGDINLVDDLYFLYVGVFDKEAFKPLAVEVMECPIRSGIDVFKSVCRLKSDFRVT